MKEDVRVSGRAEGAGRSSVIGAVDRSAVARRGEELAVWGSGMVVRNGTVLNQVSEGDL